MLSKSYAEYLENKKKWNGQKQKYTYFAINETKLYVIFVNYVEAHFRYGYLDQFIFISLNILYISISLYQRV